MDMFLKVRKEDVGFITTIIESFEGVASVRNPKPDPKSEFTILQCIVAPDQADQMELIVRDLGKDHYIKKVSQSEPS